MRDERNEEVDALVVSRPAWVYGRWILCWQVGGVRLVSAEQRWAAGVEYRDFRFQVAFPTLLELRPRRQQVVKLNDADRADSEAIGDKCEDANQLQRSGSGGAPRYRRDRRRSA